MFSSFNISLRYWVVPSTWTSSEKQYLRGLLFGIFKVIMGISVLWRRPELNPLNQKAYTVPVLNPVNTYGRTFFFSTFGFMIAFMSWYAFPPLLSKTIKKDLHLTQNDIANSNVLALTATLLVRAIAGPLCDRFGPRLTYVSILLAGAIPTAMAGLVKDAKGLIVLRFFVGILGGSFVPCQVWSTQFFDRKVVGTANGLMAGFGNAGGGITYFVMPAIFDSLVHERGLTDHVAWRVAFIVPFILITSTALGMLLLCEDTPTGAWADRHNRVHELTQTVLGSGHAGTVVDVPKFSITNTNDPSSDSGTNSTIIDEKKSTNDIKSSDSVVLDAPPTDIGLVVESEVVQSPTLKESLNVIFSLQCMLLALPYACSFGGELAINSILGSYYLKNFHDLNQTTSGRWAAMFGLVNIFFRPLGGILSDVIYNSCNKHNSRFVSPVQAKKFWLITLGTLQGVMCLLIGRLNSHEKPTMFVLVVLLAVFMDGSNGANFALVPHVHPHANGIISGIVGATGNLGGVIFALLFRFNGVRYDRVIWIIGVASIAINWGVSWVKPIPKGQIGGR